MLKLNKKRITVRCTWPNLLFRTPRKKDRYVERRAGYFPALRVHCTPPTLQISSTHRANICIVSAYGAFTCTRILHLILKQGPPQPPKKSSYSNVNLNESVIVESHAWLFQIIFLCSHLTNYITAKK